MATLITDPSLEEQLIAERQASGGDRFDEVWEGMYVMAPTADEEHQGLASRLVWAFTNALGGDRPIDVYGSVNVSDRRRDWRRNYRCPDLVVVLERSRVVKYKAYLYGGPDFVAEITSPGDRTREKLEFYAAIGVREFAIIDRNPWSIELYRLRGKRLVEVGRATLKKGAAIESKVLSLSFRLVRAKPRPRIEVARVDGTALWLA